MPDAVVRLLYGLAVLTFVGVGGLSVYTFLALPLGKELRGRCVWFLGAALVAGSILTVGITVLLVLSRMVGL